ncbi:MULTISPECIES: MFS transporter [Thalassospira]|jgi:predicted MFS family arabinose efflux permease|uniref:MFS transporter n=2 Tax=Thalassospiraceae TaxID=2844866 RepID=UPI0008287CC7|nr:MULTISPECIES: MFS transporter [Thalassospira]MAB31569.1 MFS transporter [Thalassospira sp.]MBA05498.1 MFS transporter [Thalassospira sp.]MDM7974618.1 MFS transporter [Thalassospira xiamenensis]OCK06205.1 major facilitator superfamily MFS_1 [Thalassospira sp. KO164]QPL35011.1 MFS transporter [Thalassospira sp. B30-1]|tara:strand:- start:1192 stop:2478 length:1287 start_codon:yes stop_codon:yes gene_type:complete
MSKDLQPETSTHAAPIEVPGNPDLSGGAVAHKGWRNPEVLLIFMAAAMPLSFSTWMALLNNFSVEMADFTGREIGILQSLREIPGFMAFTAIFVLIILREQTFALISLLVLGIGVAISGYFPTVVGLYCTTVLMSIGFHYFETMQQALSLQWVKKDRTAMVMGRQLSAKSLSSLVMFGIVWAMLELLDVEYRYVYLFGGALTVIAALFAWMAFPKFADAHPQTKKLILRKRYWLYYALTFMSGARRQIFTVFAGFLMVEKFGYDAATITLLFLLNHAINMVMAPKIGKLIGKWGERKALTFEYIGLFIVFVSYAFVESDKLAGALYVIDHLFFAMAIAIKTYFQKIADPADISSTAGVSFTINHIAAVFIPVAFGLLWLISPSAVFLAGAAMALVSLVLALNVPDDPEPGKEVVMGYKSDQPMLRPAE